LIFLKTRSKRKGIGKILKGKMADADLGHKKFSRWGGREKGGGKQNREKLHKKRFALYFKITEGGNRGRGDRPRCNHVGGRRGKRTEL